MHLAAVNSVLPHETSVVEIRKSPGILKAERPGFAAIKKNPGKVGIVHRPLERSPDVMAAP